MQAFAFLRGLDRDAIPPVIFLLGEERFLHTHVQKKLIQEHLGPEGSKDAEHVDASSSSMSGILDSAASAGLFSARRVMVIHNAEELKTPAGSPELESLKGYLDRPDPELVLIFDAEKVNRNHHPFKLLSSKAQVVECNRIKGDQLLRWMHDHVKGRGYRLQGNVAARIQDLLGNDMQLIVRSLEKIMLYCGDRREIESEDVDACLGSMREHAVWELTNAIGNRDKATALALLGELLTEGKHPLQITTALQYQFRQLLNVKALLLKKLPPAEIAKAAGIRFYVERVIQQARRFAAPELLAAYNTLFDCENALKSAGPDDRYILERGIIDICTARTEGA